MGKIGSREEMVKIKKSPQRLNYNVYKNTLNLELLNNRIISIKEITTFNIYNERFRGNQKWDQGSIKTEF